MTTSFQCSVASSQLSVIGDSTDNRQQIADNLQPADML
jgi:hypothetical protein